MEEKEKYCSIVFDEMSHDLALHYNGGKDIIEGFQDNGPTEERNL